MPRPIAADAVVDSAARKARVWMVDFMVGDSEEYGKREMLWRRLGVLMTLERYAVYRYEVESPMLFTQCLYRLFNSLHLAEGLLELAVLSTAVPLI